MDIHLAAAAAHLLAIMLPLPHLHLFLDLYSYLHLYSYLFLFKYLICILIHTYIDFGLPLVPKTHFMLARSDAGETEISLCASAASKLINIAEDE